MGGEHGHGDHHHHEVKIPDYKIYKVENCPELMEVQRALGAQGLKDPWLRNEAWRFNVKEFSTHGQRFRGFFFRGFSIGVAAFAITIIGEKIFLGGDDHGHGHH